MTCFIPLLTPLHFSTLLYTSNQGRFKITFTPEQQERRRLKREAEEAEIEAKQIELNRIENEEALRELRRNLSEDEREKDNELQEFYKQVILLVL
jgi:hypothetical protein